MHVRCACVRNFLHLSAGHVHVCWVCACALGICLHLCATLEPREHHLKGLDAIDHRECLEVRTRLPNNLTHPLAWVRVRVRVWLRVPGFGLGFGFGCG